MDFKQTLSQARRQRCRFYRHRAAQRLKITCISAVVITLIFLGTLLGGIAFKGVDAFYKHQIALDISFDPQFISQSGHCQLSSLLTLGFARWNFTSPSKAICVSKELISPAACQTLLPYLRKHPERQGQTALVWLPVSDDVDLFLKNRQQPTARLSPSQIELLTQIDHDQRLRQRFNTGFFYHGDSRTPEYAGISSALVGSCYLIVISLLFAFPLGVAAAIYLEEFRPLPALGRWIDVSIANLAAVPSIIYGLLGLSVFINFLGLPRSSSLVGGLTLGVMILPVILITTRTALQNVPLTIRTAAQALGASDVQVVLHHVLPLALPGIVTGTLLATARILGETAPLLMIGMLAFVRDVPTNSLHPATALPVQIFMWARMPEPGFMAHASAGILMLLLFLGLMSGAALFIRHKFEHKWLD